jgi:phenylacetyl-CoA:acceptor oxidoreductase subunit 2
MVFAAIFTAAGVDSYVLAPLACVLAGAGLFAVFLEIGRPLRALNVLRNPFTSWMSREAWAGVILILCALAAFRFQSAPMMYVAGVAALTFLYCQACILKDCRGIPAWRVTAIVPLIMSTGLAEGMGLILILATLLSSLSGVTASLPVILVAFGVIACRVISWQCYLRAIHGNVPHRAGQAIGKTTRPFLLYGNLLPALLLACGLITDRWLTPVTVIAAGCVIGSGWLMKYMLVTRAGFDQGFSLLYSPARGAGRPGPGIQPGWPEQQSS